MKNLVLAVTVLTIALAGCDSSSTPEQPISQDRLSREFQLWLRGSHLRHPANGDGLNGHSFLVEVADTDKLRRRGLSGREHLPPGKGMLFVMPAPIEMRIWMKGCLLPLDVLFFDPQGRLINFHTMAIPSAKQPDYTLPIYSSDKPAKYALEVAAGTAHQLTLKQGLTTISFSPALLKRLQEGTE